MRTRTEIIAAARGCVGARFRPHGRDPAWGLDCVGVAAIAFEREVVGDYRMRGGELADIEARARDLRLCRIAPDVAAAGDLVAIAEAGDQLHLAVLTERGFVDAHAGLRRVVETPGRPANIVAAWEEAG